jgi:methionine biosynthesis protein MetW
LKVFFKNFKKLFKYSGFKLAKFEKPKYHFKPNFLSTHSKTFDLIKKNSTVLDIGCNNGQFLDYLRKKKNCKTVGIDKDYTNKQKNIIKFDLDLGLPNINYSRYDYIVMLDVIEHLNKPEKFLFLLLKKIKSNKNVKIIFSTPNIAFFPMRLSLLFGNFNYASKGILDFTHKRLFTFASFKHLLINSNFKIIGIPAPFPAVIGKNFFSILLLKLNYFFIKISKKLFSFQMIFITKI